MIKLKTLLPYSILLFIAISCGQQSAVKETPIDSVAQSKSIAVESSTPGAEAEVIEEPAEPDEPAIESSALTAPQFNFFKGTITDNPVEDSTVSALGRIIKEFNTQGFVTIRKIDTHGDPVTGELQRMTTPSITMLNGNSVRRARPTSQIAPQKIRTIC